MTATIVLIDDHVVVREAIRHEIEKKTDFRVIGEAGDGREGVGVVEKLKPDLVLMDISLPNLNGVDATRLIIASLPETKILGLSMHSDRFLVTEMLKAGAKGYLVKQCNAAELIEALNAVARGYTYISPSVAGMIVDGFLGRKPSKSSSAFNLLSIREREVLQLMAEGKSTKDIARRLSISVSTVETHRRQLKNKLKIDNQADLIKFAILEGLTTLDG